MNNKKRCQREALLSPEEHQELLALIDDVTIYSGNFTAKELAQKYRRIAELRMCRRCVRAGRVDVVYE